MDIYQQVTDRILKQLEQGVVPWRKTWGNGLPKSLTTGREYRGINILLLASAGYSSRYWVTYREAQRLGGQVRKGEKATPVYFWHWRTQEELAKLAKKTGKKNLAPCTCFLSFAFNLEQVEGISRPDDDLANHQHDPVARADSLIEVMPDKPEIVHQAQAQPAYNRRNDRVTLPHLGGFESAAEYYTTLFHELMHSTGHPKRLDRVAEAEGDRMERYSFEELIAEFGASFLCSFSGIENRATEELTAAYIDSWAQVFRKDNRILMRAASAAQRGADYIRGKIAPETAGEHAEVPADSLAAA
jgi:antirestriction protein ArdC